VAAAVEAVQQQTRPGELPYFWIDNFNDPSTKEYRALMCAFLVHGASMWHYPAVDQGRRYPPGTLLVLATRDRNVFPDANVRMTDAGMPLQLVAQRQIAQGATGYWLTFVRTGAAPAPQ